MKSGRVVSRPHLATVSGVPAVMNITHERVVFPQGGGGGQYVTAYNVSSGVTLRILPTVTAGGETRAEIDVEDSKFVPTAQNVAVEKAKNAASTTMIVKDGDSIIIGGLQLDRCTRSDSGVPGLRKVVITPRIYTPGMSDPVSSPKRFR